MRESSRLRLAIVVSHPVQYYVPLYRRLAARGDIAVRVFYTWHDGRQAVRDPGFQLDVNWDLGLDKGYDYEVVRNTARRAGTSHFFGLRNPALRERVESWSPDVVHVTGWAWWSHLQLLYSLADGSVSTLFRGDSTLIGARRRGFRWWAKSALLRRIYSWPTAFLAVGKANRDYFMEFGVRAERLFECPHSIEVSRFAQPNDEFEAKAGLWRRELKIGEDQRVLLFAGKFEAKKQPLELARAFLDAPDSGLVLVMVGDGEFAFALRDLERRHSRRLRVIPFQNQSRMPVVYRLGDIFILPSAHSETWGLAVNEALACGTPVLVSDRVGCAMDVVDESCGRIFPWSDLGAAVQHAREMAADPSLLAKLSKGATLRSVLYDVALTEASTIEAARAVKKK